MNNYKYEYDFLLLVKQCIIFVQQLLALGVGVFE